MKIHDKVKYRNSISLYVIKVDSLDCSKCFFSRTDECTLLGMCLDYYPIPVVFKDKIGLIERLIYFFKLLR